MVFSKPNKPNNNNSDNSKGKDSKKPKNKPFEATAGQNNSKAGLTSPYLKEIAQSLSRRVTVEQLAQKVAPTLPILALVGAGAFLAASIAVPTLPQVFKLFLNDQGDEKAWKRFNLRHLKRTLDRLEKRQLIKYCQAEGGQQTIVITQAGQAKLLRTALNETTIEKPKMWGGDWYLISYDIPEDYKERREALKEHLKLWNFYPLHESMYLHAYPCLKQVEFLREYLGIGEFVRVFVVRKIENDQQFRDFFGV
jgi:DNA-binding PadR family transcriptional regulator